MKKLNKYVLTFALIFIALTGVSISIAETLATIKTSGMIFKDTLEVLAFDDPDVAGATCFVTLPKRALSMEDQTDTSISCRKVAEITGKMTSREKIFRNRKSVFFKSMFVDRIFDEKRNVLVYVSYTKKLSGDNASNSISVIPLNDHE